MKVGIIGNGVVGKACHNSLPVHHDVDIYDPPLGYEELPLDTQALFICVPTPTKNGKQDVSILDDTLLLLSEAGYEGLVIIKSTTLPKNLTSLMKKHENLNIMVSPEFLDQNKPYFEEIKHLMGVKDIYQANLYREIFFADKRDDFRTTNPETAMMAKYVHNCYGALKVTFFNEVKDICDSNDIDYREMVGALLSSTDHISRAYTRMAVDGMRGFGGACFGKDIIAFNDKYDCDTTKAAAEKNKYFRPGYMESMDNVL